MTKIWNPHHEYPLKLSRTELNKWIIAKTEEDISYQFNITHASTCLSNNWISWISWANKIISHNLESHTTAKLYCIYLPCARKPYFSTLCMYSVYIYCWYMYCWYTVCRVYTQYFYTQIFNTHFFHYAYFFHTSHISK
jgi:hypothetical protein